MKTFLIMVAATTLSGAALAQGTTTTTQTPMTQDAPITDPATDAPADAGTMQTMQNDPAMTQPTQTDSSQSMQQTAPNAGTMPMQSGNMPNMSGGNMAGMQPGMASGTYPRCSATVTDRCMQVAGSTRSRRRR